MTGAIAPEVTIQSLLAVLERVRFRYTCETELQDGVAQALANAGLPYAREKSLSSRDRPDFLVDGHIAVEIKIQGTFAQAVRQVNRYAEHQDVKTILLLGSPHWLVTVPPVIGGKPVYAFRLTGSLL